MTEPSSTEARQGIPVLSPTATRTTRYGPTPPASDSTRILRGIRADGTRLSLAEHVALHGPLPHWPGTSGEHPVVRAADAAGLLGKGGGRFPLARKMRTVVESAGPLRRPVVVVNAAESEPASRKDAALLSLVPHLVLDGAVAAAAAVNAREIVLWLHRGEPAKRRAVEAAIAERRGARLPGRFRVVEGPPRYVGGEASAMASFLSGGEARPRMSPPRVAERGVDGRPTLVSNAETLAHLALVVRHGPTWYRGLGTAAEPGTALITLTGAVALPGVIEVGVGTSIGAILAAAGGTTSNPAALLIGGYAGTWVPAERGRPLTWAAESLASAGVSGGVGLIAVLPEGACVVAETARLAGWLAGEGAQQCGPCLNGLPALAKACRTLATGPAADSAPPLLRRWAGMVEGRGACHHPDGVAGLVRSMLEAFPEEVARHAAGLPCASAHATARQSVLALPAPEHGELAWR